MSLQQDAGVPVRTPGSIPLPLLQPAPLDWFHRPLPHRRCLLSAGQGDASEGALAPLGPWLIRAAVHHPLELRFCASGQHAGFWVGVGGLGASPRHARTVRNRSVRHLATVLHQAQVPARRATPRPLPPCRLGLSLRAPHRPATGGTTFVRTRAQLAAISLQGSPLVVRVQMTALGRDAALVTDALETHSRAAGDLRLFGDGLGRGQPSRTPALPVLTSALGLHLWVGVHGKRLPGPLAVRLLRGALELDLATRLALADTPTPLPAAHTLLGDALNFLGAPA